MTLLEDPTILIPFAGFLTLFLLGLGVTQFIRVRSSKKDIIQKIKFSGNVPGSSQGYAAGDQENSVRLNPLVSFLKIFGTRTRSETAGDGRSKRLRFLKAGIHKEYAPAVFYGLKYLLVIILPSVFMALRLIVFEMVSYELTIAIFVLTALLGYYLPDIWLKQKTDKRSERLLKALPDALDLLVVCVEAGMGLDEGFNRVTHEIKLSSPDLSDEFALLSLELRAGTERQKALRNLALRTNIEEVKNLVTLLVQADKFGTSVATTLRVYAETFRIERMQKAEEMAAKIPVKLVFPLILFIFPALFVAILGPAVIRIYRNIILGGV